MHIPSAFRLLSCLLIFSVSSAIAQQSPTKPPVQATAIVTVTDHSHHLVTGLKAEDFTLYADGQKLPISSVASDVPACIGLLIDRSGSMRGRHAAIASAMADLVRASNANDKFFVVTFNDDPFLDRDFTGDPSSIEQTIARADARGGTALYDAIIASTDHLAENKECSKRALLIVGDGQDNSSRKSLEYTLASLHNGENPFIYVIWLPHPNGTSHHAESALAALTVPSGGAAYFVKSPDEVRKTALKIAEELKSQYTISYAATAKSANPNIKIEAHAAGHKDLTVHANVAGPKVNLPVPAAAIRNSCIAGTVLDENRKPVSGMNVEAFPVFSPNSYAKNSYPSIVSDEKGKFKITDLESGTYALYSSNETAGYPSTRNSFYRTVNALPTQALQKCSSVVVKVGPKAARLKIKAVDASTGAPLANFGVSLRKQSGGILVIQRATPGQEVLVPPHADLAISAWSYGFPKSQYIVVTTPGSDASQDVTVQLTPGSASSASSNR